jgi:Na+/phosphate symporter
MVFFVILGVAILGGVIYMAISRRSDFKVRIAALGALAVRVVAVIISLLTFYKGSTVPKQQFLPDTLPSDVIPAAESTNILTIVMFIIFLIALFVLVLVVSLREHKRSEDSKNVTLDKNRW